MSISLQKANFWKRISAYLLDAILAVVLTTGLAAVISRISDYDKQVDKLEAYQTEYTVPGIDKFNITEEEYEQLPEELQAQYDQACEAFQKDARVIKTNQTIFYLLLMILALSLLFSHLILYFIVPLFFDNGQTIGKKVFGLAVMRTNCVKISNSVLFVRSILGLYTMETMVPVLFILMINFGMLGLIGLLMLLLLLILQIGVMIYTKTNSSIHDLLSDTVVVDYASQKIFDTQEELLAFKQEEHEREVNSMREQTYERNA